MRMLAGKSVFAGMVFALLMAGAAIAGEMPRAKPEKLGFSAERLDYIDKFYAEKVKNGEMAGVVTLVARRGKVVHFNAVGFTDVETQQEMETDTLFRIYSMTKPIASTALMMLYEEGRFQLYEPVSAYIPEFKNLRALRDPEGPVDDTVPLEREPTIQDIMRHTSGFSHGLGTDDYENLYTEAGVFDPDGTLEEMMTKLSKIPLKYQPGTRFFYSLSPEIQARLVEIISGMPFDELLEQRLFGPLGMDETDFFAPADSVDRLAAVHWSKNGELTTFSEENGHPEGGVLFQLWSIDSFAEDNALKSGSFGLVSKAEDYWRFAQMMANGGEFEGKRYLSPRTVDFMASDHLAAQGIEGPGSYGFGLGFAVVEDPAAVRATISKGAFYWSGAAATQFWIDPEEELVVVAMTQHMRADGIGAFWGQLRAMVYAALID